MAGGLVSMALITAGLMTFSSLSLIALTMIYALLALLLSLVW